MIGVKIKTLSNGNILVVVQKENDGEKLVCFNTNGSLDTSFGTQGQVSISLDAFSINIASQSSGKIIFGGMMYRYGQIFAFNENSILGWINI